jgi:hypothetical protein
MIVTSPLKRFFEKRFGPTLDELEELQEIERIANFVCDHFKHTA